MAKKEDAQYGIKYRVIPLETNKYILFPVSLEKGIETDDGFRTGKRIFPYAFDIEELDNTYVVDMIFTQSELQFVYEYEGEEQLLMDYFFADVKDTLVYLETDPKKGYTTRNEINLDIINAEGHDLTYVMDKSLPAIILNESALNELLNSEDLEEVKLIIAKYKRLIQTFKEYNQQRGITKINVSDGKIESVELKQRVEQDPSTTPKKDIDFSSVPIASARDLYGDSSVSYRGLREYIRERVFGHDKAIATFAQKLYMNYTAEEGDTVESILLVGPTGTGKTETVNAACEYLDIPHFQVNASNLVPQGIKGMNIEDVIVGLFEQAGYDEEKAQRGLIFLDEFDKLNETDMDLKSSMKNILLTFTAGGVFPIDNDRYTFSFDSSMTSKVYAGVFDRISRKKKRYRFWRRQKKNFIKFQVK